MTNAAAPNAAAAWADSLEALAVSDGSLPAPLAITAATSSTLIGRMVLTAAKLLVKFATGTVKIVRRGEQETGNPLKPFQDETAKYPRNAYVGGYPSDRIDGVNIMAADLRVICDAKSLPVKPTAADAVEIDSATLAIVRVAQIPAAGVPVLYILQARAA